MRLALLASVTASATLGLAACSDAMPARDATTSTSAPVASTAQAMRGPAVVSVRNSRFGRILTDGKGFTLYLFTRDKQPRSRCYGACATAWPPLLSTGPPRAGKGAKQSLLGATKRSDGQGQVTYRGHPLYYYVGERKPLQVLCQDVFEFGGRWLVVSPRGRGIR